MLRVREDGTREEVQVEVEECNSDGESAALFKGVEQDDNLGNEDEPGLPDLQQIQALLSK